MARQGARGIPGAGAERRSPRPPTRPELLPPADAAIATLWSSAYPLLHMPQGAGQVLLRPGQRAAVLSGRLRLGDGRGDLPLRVSRDRQHARAGRGVSLVRQPGGVVRARRRSRALPPADAAARPRGAPVRVFFYGRPKTPRNSFGLGLAALRRTQAPTTAIASRSSAPARTGARRSSGCTGKIRNLGVLGSLDEVAALYRSCDIGLVFMHTKHPSYQPFEFMASGMATVSNINPATALAAARRRELPADPAAADADGRAAGAPGRGPAAARADRRRRPGGGPPLPLGRADRARVAGDQPADRDFALGGDWYAGRQYGGRSQLLGDPRRLATEDPVARARQIPTSDAQRDQQPQPSPPMTSPGCARRCRRRSSSGAPAGGSSPAG